MDCTKKRFADRGTALVALHQARIAAEEHGSSGPRRVYHCTRCDGWHFTSRQDLVIPPPPDGTRDATRGKARRKRRR